MRILARIQVGLLAVADACLAILILLDAGDVIEGVAAGWRAVYYVLGRWKRPFLAKDQLVLAVELLIGERRMSLESTQENICAGLLINKTNISILVNQ